MKLMPASFRSRVKNLVKEIEAWASIRGQYGMLDSLLMWQILHNDSVINIIQDKHWWASLSKL